MSKGNQRILVLGAGGMVGHVAAVRLSELGYTVIGFARRAFTFCEKIIECTMVLIPL